MNDLVKIELPFQGFYESIHDAMLDDAVEGNFQDDQGELLDEYADIIWDADIDWQRLRKSYCREYVALFATEYELDINFDELTSPREYNFSSDRLFCTIPRTEIDKVQAEVYEDADWQAMVNDTFTSYDGFSSFYPTDLTAEEWTRDTLDECQYQVVIQHWLNMKYRDDPNNNHDINELEYQIAGDIELYNLDGLNEAIDAIESAKKEAK